MIQVDANVINKLLNDVAIIKEFVLSRETDSEGEVTKWVENELDRARKIPRSENISLVKLETRISRK